MARRLVTARRTCAHPGCGEARTFEYDTQRERAADDKRQQQHPYRCVRHTQPDEVLSPTNPERTTVLTVGKFYHRGEPISGLYWCGPGGGSGLLIEPGFRAFADDFPEGTRLVITARIELPYRDPQGGR